MSLHGRPGTAIALHPATLTNTGRSVNASVSAHSLSLRANLRSTDEPHTVDVDGHVHHDYQELPPTTMGTGDGT